MSRIEEIAEGIDSADEWMKNALGHVGVELGARAGAESFEDREDLACLQAARDLLEAARTKLKYARLIHERVLK